MFVDISAVYMKLNENNRAYINVVYRKIILFLLNCKYFVWKKY